MDLAVLSTDQRSHSIRVQHGIKGERHVIRAVFLVQDQIPSVKGVPRPLRVVDACDAACIADAQISSGCLRILIIVMVEDDLHTLRCPLTVEDHVMGGHGVRKEGIASFGLPAVLRSIGNTVLVQEPLPSAALRHGVFSGQDTAFPGQLFACADLDHLVLNTAACIHPKAVHQAVSGLLEGDGVGCRHIVKVDGLHLALAIRAVFPVEGPGPVRKSIRQP